MISEAKLESSFPKGQFHLHCFSEPYRLDRNGNGGWILKVIRDGILSRLTELQMRTEGFFVELNFVKKEWLLCCSYNPEFSQISLHSNKLDKNLDTLTSKLLRLFY